MTTTSEADPASGSAAAFPFEMGTVVGHCGKWLAGAHSGLDSTIVGLGILAARRGV